MSDTGLNLYAKAAIVVRESPSPDPTLMVDELFSQLDPSEYPDVIKSLLRDVVTACIRNQRSERNGGAPNAAASKKQRLVAEAWRIALDTPEFIPSSNRWVFLRDATHDQVLEMCGMRMQKSQELAANARRYEQLARAMERHGVSQVSDLDESVLAGLLSRESATPAVRVA